MNLILTQKNGASQSIEVRAQYASGAIRDIATESGPAELDVVPVTELAEVEEELDDLIAQLYPDGEEMTDDVDD